MRKIRIFAATALIAAFVVACGSIDTDEAASSAADLAALVVVEEAYHDAKVVLHGQFDGLPTETGLALLELEAKADALVTDFRAAWDHAAPMAEMEQLIERASAIYTEGKSLITPHLAAMSLEERQRLRRLDSSWIRVETAYERWQANPVAEQRREMVTAGLKLATTLMLLL